MIDFNTEILKYKPIMEVEDVEVSINNDDMKDLFDLLKYVGDKKPKQKE